MSIRLCCHDNSVHEFTHLLVHIVSLSNPVALTHIDAVARRLVTKFFAEHTNIDIAEIELHFNKFTHLQINSRIEIAFEGRPLQFRVPDYRVYTHTDRNYFIIFDLETRVIQRYIEPGVKYSAVEVERTDLLPTYDYRTSVRN